MGRERSLRYKRHQAEAEFRKAVESGTSQQIAEAGERLRAAEHALNDFRGALQEPRSTGSAVILQPNDSWRDYKARLRTNLSEHGTQVPRPGQPVIEAFPVWVDGQLWLEFGTSLTKTSGIKAFPDGRGLRFPDSSPSIGRSHNT